MLELSSRPRKVEENVQLMMIPLSSSSSNNGSTDDNGSKPLLLSSSLSTSSYQQKQQQQQREKLIQTPTTMKLAPTPPVINATSTVFTIQRKLCLLAPLLLCLYMLTDSNYYSNNEYHPPSSHSSESELDSQQHQKRHHHHHLAFVTALSRHPPSLRVFRIVSEGAFLLACAAFALWIWDCGGGNSSAISTTTTSSSPTRMITTLSKNGASSFSMADENINESDDDDDDDDEENGKIQKGIAGDDSSTAVLRINAQTVGKLLFAPPPLLALAPWGNSGGGRLLRLVPNRINKKKRNRRPSRRISGGIGNDRSGNGSSGSISSGCGSDMSNVEYPKDGSSHSLKRRKNSPSTATTTTDPTTPPAASATTTAFAKGNENGAASVIAGGAMSPSVLAAAATAAATVVDTTTTAEIRTFDKSDDDHDMPAVKHRQQPSLSFSFHTTTTTHPRPPSPITVLGASLDIITVACMFLIFFTISSAEGGRYIDQASDHVMWQQYMKFIANVAAPLFPLTLFGLSLLAVFIPWKKRSSLWNILSLTWCAPFYPVTFQDGFIGDILTSIVRPLQDLAFTILFVPLGLKAWWSSDMYTMDAAAIPLERSWLLHTVVLPACTLSPLWWRFMQNLRQCYDAKQRWPYLGNALKYLLAAEVSTFGLFNPSVKQSPLWMMCFFLTTLYQVWWDVFMDWGLLERGSNLGYFYATADRRRWFWWWPYTLRSKRLYKRTWMYHVIFSINFCLRFVGMITLIPPVYLSRTTGLIVSAYKDPDFQLFVGLFVALAEIFRRTIWALLRLEWEVIKTAPVRKTMERKSSSTNSLEPDVMKPMAIATSDKVWSFPTERGTSVSSLSDMSNLNDIQILSELCVWATLFSGIAIIAAAHREVL